MKNAFVIGFRRMFSMHHAERLAALCLLFFTLGIGNVWGATVTYSQTSTSAASVSSGTAPTGSSVSFSNTYSTKEQLTKDNTMILTLTSLGGINISNITLSMKSNKSGGAGKLSYSTDGGTNWTYLVGSSGSGVVFSNASWNGSYTQSYTDISKNVSLSNVTQLKIRIEATANSLYCQSFKLTYTTAVSYSVAWTINPAAGGSLSATSGTSTTVTPNAAYTYGSPAYTVTTGSASVSQSTNTFTATPSANCTIRINMVEKPKYTVTLKDNDTTLTQTSYDAAVTLPSRTGCAGYSFAGWTKSWTEKQDEWTTTSPIIIPAGSYTPTNNENLYPVYTKTEGGGTIFSQYQKISLGESITDGKYLISTGTYTMSGEGKIGVSFSPGTTEATDKEYTITTLGSGIFSIKGPDDKYVGGSSGSTTLSFNVSTPSTDNYKWKYNKTGINFQGQTTRYIQANGTTDFRNYAGSGTTTYLYKRIEIGGSTTSYMSVPDCCTPLDAINGSFNGGTQKVTWEAVTDASGYKVKVENSSHSTVTDWADIGGVHEYSTSSLTCGGVTYYVYVKAYNNNNAGHCTGDGPSSTAIEVTTAECTAPAITVNPSSLTGLNYIVGAGPSAAQSFSMSGMNLTSETLTITAPTDFEVSLDNSNWGDSKTKSASGTLAATTVYVRLAAGKSAGEYSGNVTISGGGLASYVSVAVSGTVLQPALSVTPASLSFGDVAVNSSKEMTFTLSGSNLKADATISVTGAGYSVSPASVSKGSGTISSETITVTYNPTATGESQTGTVTISSTGADNKTVSLTGNSKAVYSVSMPSPSNGTVTADKTSGIIAGETVTLTITPSSGYQLASISAADGSSNDVSLTGTGNTRTFTMPASNVTVTATFMVRTDYVLVTNISQLSDGDIITIATMKGNNAEGRILDGQNQDNRATKIVTTTADGKIADSDVDYPILLEHAGEVWKLYDQRNKGYLYAYKGQNYLRTGNSLVYNLEWIIEIAQTEPFYKALIHQQACNTSDCNEDSHRYIEYNSTNNVFSGYKNTLPDGYIYKKELGCDRLPAPTGLSATAVTQTTCTLSWTAVANASGYEVSLDNGSSWTSAGTNTSYNATGLTQGTTYNWKVRATGTGDYCDKGTAAANTVTMKKAVTVTYDDNGATEGQLPVTGGVVNLTEDESYTILGNTGNGGPVLSKDGYTFDGWHSSSTYNATPAYTIGGTVTVTANITLYANWKPKRDTFIDGVHGTEDQYGEAGYTVPSCSDQSRATSGDCEQTHYKFIGWALMGADLTSPANIITAGSTKTATGATYYAVWGEEL